MKELKKLSIVWGLLMLGLFILLTTFALVWKSKNAQFEVLENNLKNVAASYYESAHSYPGPGEVIKVSVEELKDAGKIEELTYKGEACQGYVDVINEDVIVFKPYIKCKNYTTKGYSE